MVCDPKTGLNDDGMDGADGLVERELDQSEEEKR